MRSLIRELIRRPRANAPSYRLPLLASAVVSLLSGCGEDSGSGPTDNGPIDIEPPTADYRMVELPGGTQGVAHDINDQGQIVGQDNGLGVIPCAASTTESCAHAVLWTVNEEGQVIDTKDLGAVGGDESFSLASGINNLGQVVGWTFFGVNSNFTRPFVWTADSGMELLDLPMGGFNGDAQAINDDGQVVGVDGNLDCGSAVVWNVALDGTVSDPQDIGTLGGEFACPSAINRPGNFVGRVFQDAQTSDGFLWAAGNVVTIPDASEVNDSNDEDELVGRTKSDEPFLWRAETGVQLLADGGRAWDINNRGQVVGTSGSRAVIWQDGEMQVLPAPALGFIARAINDEGMIVGSSGSVEPRTAILWVPN